MSPNLLWLEFKDVKGSGTSHVEAGEQGSATPIGWGQGMKTRFSVNQGCQKPTPHARCVHRGGTARMRAWGLFRAAQAPQRWCP